MRRGRRRRPVWAATVAALAGVCLVAQAPRPQDDLFTAANAEWLAAVKMPEDRVSYSAAAELADEVETQIQAIVDDLMAGTAPRKGSEEQLIVDLYRSVVDHATVDGRGLTPIAGDLERLRAVSNAKQASALAGTWSVSGEGGPFEVTLVSAGRRAATAVARVTPGGILLPDWSYYLTGTRETLTIRRAYAEYLSRIFRLGGVADEQAAADAGAVIAFETHLAEAMRATEGQVPSPRVWSMGELQREMPGFDWRAWGEPQGLHRAGGIILTQPEFFRQFSALVGKVPASTLAAWLRARFLTATAPYLPSSLSNARFEFFGTTLTGQRAPRDRWKRGVSMVSEHLGDAVGRRYVARHFSAESRARVRAIVDEVTAAARAGIRTADWIPEEARERATQRLATIDAKVGYPDQWRSYAGLDIRADDLLGNVRRLRTFETTYRMERARRPAASLEWLMTAQTVNAYYSPSQQEFVLPAGLLQPPYFDPKADDATNYGSVGAVIGHELSHALDVRPLARRADSLRQQFAGFDVIPGLRLNADVTFAESLADVVGLQLAHKAWRRARGDAESPVIAGRTGDQRFLLAWARVWRSLYRPDFLRYTNATSPHAPGHLRANGTVSHLDVFYSAFDVKPGDKLYLPPELRVRAW